MDVSGALPNWDKVQAEGGQVETGIGKGRMGFKVGETEGLIVLSGKC